MSDALLVERGNGLVTITLNRPEHRNAMTAEMIGGLARILDDLRGDESIATVVFRGAGNHFSEGRDESSLGDQLTYSAHRLRQAFDRIRRLNLAISTFPAITIAAVRGVALGAGCGLACHCDIVLAAEDAEMGFPEIERGLPPTIVMSYLGRLLMRRAAFELVVTGRRVGGAEAVRLGLATRVVPSGELDRALSETVDLLASKSAFALRRCKEFWTDTRDMTMDEAFRYGISHLATLMTSDEIRGSVARSIGLESPPS